MDEEEHGKGQVPLMPLLPHGAGHRHVSSLQRSNSNCQIPVPSSPSLFCQTVCKFKLEMGKIYKWLEFRHPPKNYRGDRIFLIFFSTYTQVLKGSYPKTINSANRFKN